MSRRVRAASRHYRFMLIGIFALLLAACGGNGPGENRGANRPSQPTTGRLAEVSSWAYQLQQIDIQQLVEANYDLLVIDYASDEGRPFSADEIARLKNSGKVVLSYLSIGEAESYRPYWDPSWVQGTGDGCAADLSEAAPPWLAPANPDWCGNYAVRFWLPEWQAIVMDYLDAILAAGFDGVYLDKVDIFYYWLGEEETGAPEVNQQAAILMVDFVGAIAAHARAVDPDFIVVPQNAPEIVEYLDDDQRAIYLGLIDGIAVEDTFFFPPGGAEIGDNPPYNPQEYVLELLADYYQPAGLPVLAVDYVTLPGKVSRFYEEARARGFIPYATVRGLDRLTMPQEP